jgi:antitoxin component YwqK of YwqJK toxin-antitoxin module
MLTHRTYFTNSLCLESITKYDKDLLLHGEQRSWWDRNHHYPKEISIYQHGTLIRTICWYINGNIKKSIHICRDMKEICEYYSSGKLKYRQNYKLGEKGFVRHGEWSGFYRNGNKHYGEIYDKGKLISRTRYISNGHPLSGYGFAKQ